MAAGVALAVITKLTPAVRVVPMYVRPRVELQVTPNRVPSEESSNTIISLFAVTAVVFTVIVVAGLAMATAPADAEAHTAGEADDAQLLEVAMPVMKLTLPEPSVRKAPACTAVGRVST